MAEGKSDEIDVSVGDCNFFIGWRLVVEIRRNFVSIDTSMGMESFSIVLVMVGVKPKVIVEDLIGSCHCISVARLWYSTLVDGE